MRRAIYVTLGLVALATAIGFLLIAVRAPVQPRAFREAAAVLQIRGPARVEEKMLDLARRLRPESPALADASPLKPLLAAVLEQDLGEIAAKDTLILLVDGDMTPGQRYPEVREFDPENQQGNVRLAAEDIAVQVNVSVIRDKLSAQVDGALSVFQTILKADGNEGALQSKAIGDLAAFLEASETLFLSIDLRDGGVVVHGSRQLVDPAGVRALDGDSDAMLNLPAGYDFYIKNVIERPLDGGKGSERVERYSFGGLDRSLTVTRCSEPESLTREWVEEMKSTAEDPGGAGSSLLLEARRYREFTFHSVEQVRIPSEEMLNQVQNRLGRAMSQALIRVFQGARREPGIIWCGHGRDLHVVIRAFDWVGARKILDAYLEPRSALSDDEFAVESLRMLPDRSTDLGLYRMRHLTNTLLKWMAATGEASAGEARSDETAPAPYASHAFSRRGSREAVDAWVPDDAMKCAMEFFQQWMRLRKSEAATDGAERR